VNPLEQLSLDELRRRTSTKWTEYDADVLPLWVAEMDVALAGPVREALERAVNLGDTGYPGRNAYAEALGAFVEDRFGWSGFDPARTSLVADVMTGAMEAVKVLSEAGDAVVVNPPVYPPFFGFLEATGRPDHDERLRAVHALIVEETRVSMLIGVAVGYELANALLNPRSEETD